MRRFFIFLCLFFSASLYGQTPTNEGTSTVSYTYYGAREGSMKFVAVRTSPTQVRLDMTAEGMHDNAYISSSSGGASTGAWYVGANPTTLSPVLNIPEGATLTVNISGGHPQGAAMNWTPASWVLTPGEELEPQTITLAPATADLPLNQLVTMTASGGQNQYVWSVTGPGVISGSGPSVDIGWSEKGTYTVSVYNEAGAGFEQSNTATATITVVDPLLPQLVTVSPAAASVVVGDKVALIASGAEAGNPYNWSTSGEGAGLASSLNQALFSASKEGVYTVKVWASAGNGYDRSDDAIATITVQPGGGGKSAVITFDNTGRDYPVTFRVYQDGVVVHTEVVPGGMKLVKRVQLKSDSPYTVTAIFKDPRLNPDNTWSPGEEEEVVVGGGTPDGPPSDATPPPPEDTPPEEPPADPETDPDGAFQQMFAEKMKNALDSATVAAGRMRDEGEKVSARFGPGPSSNPSVPTATPSGAHDLGTHGGKALAILKDPFSPDGPFGGVMASAAALVKRLIAWGVVLTFVIWLQGRVREMILNPFAVAPFGNGLSSAANSASVLGVSVGQGIVVRLVVLAALLIVLLAMPLACLAAVQGGLPWAELTQTAREGVNITSGPSMLQSAIALAGKVVPWGVLLAAPAWYFIVNNVIFPSQLFWTMFIKFIP